MKTKIITALFLGLLLVASFSGCTEEETGGDGTPTPEPAESEVDSSDIPMPENGGEENEAPPELPL